MGTNYYAIPKMSDEAKEHVKKCLDNNMLLEAKESIPGKIHIGKSSSGWRFCFNHNHWDKFGQSLEALQGFLKNSEITDEYGRHVSYEIFWDLVEAKQQYKSDTQYCEQHFDLDFSTSTEFS